MTGRTAAAEIAQGVHRVALAGCNVYLVRSGDGWVLVDAAWPGQAARIRRAAESVYGARARPSAIVLTHLHPDHQGSALALSRCWDLPVHAHADELPMADVAYDPRYADPIGDWLEPLVLRAQRHPWGSRREPGLRAVLLPFAAAVPGLPDWTAVPVPGHTVGSVALFRPADRALLTGDAVLTVDIAAPWRNLSRAPRLAGPPWVSTWNPRRALASARALAALDPGVLGPGHGREWTGEGTAAALRGLADRLERKPRWARDPGPGKAPQPRRTYRSLVVGERGGPEVLRPAQNLLRAPGRAEVRVRVLASLVCGPDVQARRGYGPFPPRLPFVPGYAVVGEVDAVGAGVRDVRVGQRVGALTIVGGYAEYVYLASRQPFPVPASVDPGAAAVVALNYLVAYQVLHRSARARAGQTVLITGAGGGIGTAFLQLGRLAGLTMYGVDTAAKHSLIGEYGAVPIDHRTQDVVAVIRRAVPLGLDAVFDGVGGDYLARGLSMLRPGGTLVAYGNPGSRRGLLRLLAITLAVNARPHGKRMKVYGTTASRHQAALEDWAALYRLLEDGRIEPVLAERLPLLDAARGNSMLEAGSVTGTVVLATPEPLADRGTAVGERESSGTAARRRS